MPTKIRTIGLQAMQVGVASTAGVMPQSMTELGLVYKNTCKIAQDSPDITEHYAEGRTAPIEVFDEKKIQKVTAQIIVETAEQMAQYIGGWVDSSGAYCTNGDEPVANRAIRLVTKQGFDIEIPNAKVVAVMNADLSSAGILLFDLTLTPMAVEGGAAYRMPPKTPASVSPTSLTIAAAGETKTLTCTSTNNITYCYSDDVDWCNITWSGKTATVVCSANTGEEQRVTNVHINVDGNMLDVAVTQVAPTE